MIKEVDRAYIAGLFEGEGNIYTQMINDKRRSRGIRLRIAMTDREPLDLFDDIVGFGTVSGPKDNGFGRKDYYEYCVTGYERIQFIICNMWDWLSPRRKEQISKALRTYTSHQMQQASKRRWRVGREI